MLADVGYIALALSLVTAVYAAGASIVGARRGVQGAPWVASARNALISIWPLMTLSCGAMIWLLVAGDFNTPSSAGQYQSTWGDLTNAFDAAGRGYGFTSPCSSLSW